MTAGEPGKTTRAAQAAQRRSQVFQLRTAGQSFEQIGQRFGISKAQAFKDTRRVLAELNRLSLESADEYRQLELARLEELHRSVWTRTTGGNLDAIATALRISERRSRLLGLDMPVRVDLHAQVESLAAATGLDARQLLETAEAIANGQHLQALPVNYGRKGDVIS